MRVKLGTDELIVRFRREATFKTRAVYGPYGRKYSVEMFNGIKTTCYGMVGETKFFEASTRHREEDVFTKSEGRRRALTKALSSVSEDTRKLVWDTYFTHHNDLEK